MVMRERTMACAVSVGAWLLGVLFVAAAALKALDFERFVAQVTRYDLLPQSWNAGGAGAVLVAELALGVLALLGLHVGRAVLGMLMLLGVFTGATLLRWQVLEGSDCRCFGALSGGGRGLIIAQDAALALVATAVLVGERRLRGRVFVRRWPRALIGATAAGLLVASVQPVPADRALLASGERGDHVRVFLSANCPHCRASLGRVRQLTEAPDMPPISVVIGADSDRQIAVFLEGQASLHHTPLTLRQLATFVPRVPTVQILSDGQLRKEWSAAVPTVTELREATRRIHGPRAGDGAEALGIPRGGGHEVRRQ